MTGALRYTFNIGPEYRAPVRGDKVWHTSFNAAFQSGYNSDANLSSYGWVKKRWLVDASIGLGRGDGKPGTATRRPIRAGLASSSPGGCEAPALPAAGSLAAIPAMSC